MSRQLQEIIDHYLISKNKFRNQLQKYKRGDLGPKDVFLENKIYLQPKMLKNKHCVFLFYVKHGSKRSEKIVQHE